MGSRCSIDGSDSGNIEVYGSKAIGEGRNNNGRNIEIYHRKAISGYNGYICMWWFTSLCAQDVENLYYLDQSHVKYSRLGKERCICSVIEILNYNEWSKVHCIYYLIQLKIKQLREVVNCVFFSPNILFYFIICRIL